MVNLPLLMMPPQFRLPVGSKFFPWADHALSSPIYFFGLLLHPSLLTMPVCSSVRCLCCSHYPKCCSSPSPGRIYSFRTRTSVISSVRLVVLDSTGDYYPTACSYFYYSPHNTLLGICLSHQLLKPLRACDLFFYPVPKSGSGTC